MVSDRSMVLIRNRATARHLLGAAAAIAPKEEHLDPEQRYKGLRREAKTSTRADKRRRGEILAEEIAECLVRGDTNGDYKRAKLLKPHEQRPAMTQKARVMSWYPFRMMTSMSRCLSGGATGRSASLYHARPPAL